MEKIHTIQVVNRRVISKVKPKFPHLMSVDYDLAIQSEYEALLELQDNLYSLREVVRQLEKDVKEAEEKWKAKQDLFDIEFEISEKEVKTQTSYMTINGKTVYDCNTKR